MKNAEIRTAAKARGVFLYEVANKLNISEPTMTRLLRKELDEAKKSEVLNAINTVAAERAASQA